MSFLVFDRSVPPGGYHWWYIDATSADGRHGLTIIAFVGSVFSPYYHHARRFRGPGARAENHVALNVALYGRPRRWCMTERGERALSRTPYRLTIGPSALTWDNGELCIDITERTAPLGLPVRGRIRLRPSALTETGLWLDAHQRHYWHPIAPFCDVDVALQAPDLAWQGQGYFDHNHGNRALETDFTHWQWACVRSDDKALLTYIPQTRDGQSHRICRVVDSNGRIRIATPPSTHRMRATPIWRMPRDMAGDLPAATRVLHTLEDTPFYARSHIETAWDGQTARGFHESLSLRRFNAPWVRTLLRFRMPRVV